MKLQHSLFILVTSLAIGQIVSKLIIQSPPDLKAALQQQYPQGIPFSIANYGDVPFGKSLSGSIYLSSHLENCIYEELESDSKNNINKIVMSARGDCTFTTKSLNSQNQGAKLAIIADNQDENPGSIIMVDDGKGPQVKIPTILISHEVGLRITNTIVNNQQAVSLVVIFETIKKQFADVSIWMNSFDRKSYILVRQLEPYFNRIKQSIKLSVFHPTSYCRNCIQTDCFKNKQYCVNTGFYGYAIEGYGRQIIRQQLREQIIMEKYPELWWKYVENYDEQCEDRATIRQCSTNSMKFAGIPAAEINQQVQKTFFNSTYQDENNKEKIVLDNKILEKNNNLRYKSGILIYPAVIVNNVTYRGNLDALEIFQLICESLENEPSGCSLDIKPPTGSIWKVILIVSLIFILAMFFLVFIYRRQARRQISKNLNKQVNDLVNQYITMYEAQRFDNQEANQQN